MEGLRWLCNKDIVGIGEREIRHLGMTNSFLHYQDRKKFWRTEIKKSKGTIWPVRVLFRYALFQIPGLAGIIFILILIRRWVDLPPWFVWGVVAIWLAKDVILFPFVWRAYDRDRLKESHSLVGTEGVAEEQLDPSGYIRVHGELWRAEAVENGSLIQKGQTVKVQGLRGLTLLVRLQGQK